MLRNERPWKEIRIVAFFMNIKRMIAGLPVMASEKPHHKDGAGAARFNLSMMINIFKNPMLRWFLIASTTAAVCLPTYWLLSVMPSFKRQMTEQLEQEAMRTGNYLAERFLAHYDPASQKLTDLSFVDELVELTNRFNIEKLKFFSHQGYVLYSTTESDIGVFNDKDYFHTIVAKGKIFSKIVQKGEQTMEGRLIYRDVAEIYVPILSEQAFIGALEIYYDITIPKQTLDRLLKKTSAISIGASVFLLGIVFFTLSKTSRADLKRIHAEAVLQQSNDRLTELVEEKTREIKITQKMSIEALAILAESYDPDTGSHLERIQNYVAILINQLKKDSVYVDYFQTRPDYSEDLILASLLHDIGKTSIPLALLTKPGKLTPEEFDRMKSHTTAAGQILDKANRLFIETFAKDSYLALARDIAMHHHEKWDGTGYPKGLKSDAIPLSARIVAVADVYDALRSKRPYKRSWSHQEAFDEIVIQAKKHFDPAVVAAFVANEDKFEIISYN